MQPNIKIEEVIWNLDILMQVRESYQRPSKFLLVPLITPPSRILEPTWAILWATPGLLNCVNDFFYIALSASWVYKSQSLPVCFFVCMFVCANAILKNNV